MWVIWRALALALACAVAAQAQYPEQSLMSPRPARVRDRDIGKPDEPSCDQLKAMWRFSKRQARAPEIMNEVANYRDPMMFNEWPSYSAIPRAAPRFRYQYPSIPRETYGRIVTKAPANVVRTPDYDEMFGTINAPQAATGKILRYSGPGSRIKSGPGFMVPPHKNRFETLKKIIHQENLRELQRRYEMEQKHGVRDVAAGRKPSTDDLAYGYSDQPEYAADEPVRGNKKPSAASRQVSQFSRYSEMMTPPARRSFYHPFYEFSAPDYYPYEY